MKVVSIWAIFVGVILSAIFLPFAEREILFYIRMPRVLTATLAGASLGLAGLISQGLFRNDLASPSIIGTQAAAILFSAISIVYLGEYFLVGSAFLGSMVSCFLLLGLNQKRLRSILLTGFALNAVFASLTSLISALSLSDPMLHAKLTSWTFGALSSRSMSHVYILALSLGFVLVIYRRHLRGLDLLSLGEVKAQTLGVNINSMKVYSVVCISLLVGAGVACAGALSFVGLIVPHICRHMFGVKHQALLIYTLLFGGILVVSADFMGRWIIYPGEIEAGVFLALLGAPFFLWLVVKKI